MKKNIFFKALAILLILNVTTVQADLFDKIIVGAKNAKKRIIESVKSIRNKVGQSKSGGGSGEPSDPGKKALSKTAKSTSGADGTEAFQGQESLAAQAAKDAEKAAKAAAKKKRDAEKAVGKFFEEDVFIGGVNGNSAPNWLYMEKLGKKLSKVLTTNESIQDFTNRFNAFVKKINASTDDNGYLKDVLNNRPLPKPSKL